MRKYQPEYCHGVSRVRYAARKASNVFHVADKRGVAYLCDCGRSFRANGGWKHCFGRVRVPYKPEWEPKEQVK